MGTDGLKSFVHTQAKMKDSDLGGGTHSHGLPQPQFPKKSCRKVWCKLELMCWIQPAKVFCLAGTVVIKFFEVIFKCYKK